MAAASHHFFGGHGRLAGPGRSANYFGGEFEVPTIWRLACICIVVPTRRRRRFWPRMMRAAAVLIRHGGLGGCPFAQDALVGKYRHRKRRGSAATRRSGVAAAEISRSAENYSKRGRVPSPSRETDAPTWNIKTIRSPLISVVARAAHIVRRAQCLLARLVEELLAALDESQKLPAGGHY